MMPHPERAASEVLRNTDGRAFFTSIIENALVAYLIGITTPELKSKHPQSLHLY